MSAVAEPGVRWWRYVKRRQLICPAGHHFKNVVKINDSGEILCQHWIAAEHRECGLRVFVFPIRGGGAIVVEITREDSAMMEELQSPAECFDYLGIFEPSALARISAPAGSAGARGSMPPLPAQPKTTQGR